MEYTGYDFYCDVALRGLVELKKEFESDNVLAFHHTKPSWPIHIVVVPKRHIPSLAEISASDTSVMIELLSVLGRLAKQVGAERGGARVLTNLGRYQDSKHLHFHVYSEIPDLAAFTKS